MEEYIVDCQLIDCGIKVCYPNNIFTEELSIDVEYKISNNGIIYNGHNIPCQKYCRRSLIGVDILIKIGHRCLTAESLYNNGKRIDSFLGLIKKIKIELSKEDSLKEVELVRHCLNPYKKPLVDIDYGYNLILDLFACEGINV